MSAAEASLSSNPTALLFYSVFRGETAQVEAALNAGASASEPVVNFWEMLEPLTHENNEKLFALFFSPGTDKLTRSSLIAPPRPPLYFAVKNGHYETTLLLLDRGANPNWTAPPQHEAISDSFALLPLAVRGGDTRLVSALLRAGADVNYAPVKGMTALRVAVKVGNQELVRLLLRAGADAAFVSPKGVTLLMEAAGHGTAGFDLDSRLPGEEIGDSFSPRRTMKMSGGDTPIKLPDTNDDSTPENYQEIARLLLEHGANLHAVVPAGHKEFDLLVGTTALQAAANTHDTKMVSLLLDGGAAPNAGGGMSGTALIDAVRGTAAMGQDMAQLLHERGANVNQADTHGGTPLMAAAATGQADLIPVLLHWGADLHARRPLDVLGESGFDALMHTARSGHADCAARLLDAGATLDARTPKGSDALMIAAFSRHTDVVRPLLERGADPARKNKEGQTARDMAQLPTPAQRMAGKMGEKYGTTPDQMAQKVREEMEAAVAETADSPHEEQAIKEALPEHIAALASVVQMRRKAKQVALVAADTVQKKQKRRGSGGFLIFRQAHQMGQRKGLRRCGHSFFLPFLARGYTRPKKDTLISVPFSYPDPAAPFQDLPRARALVLRWGWNAACYQILNPGITHYFLRCHDAVIGYAPARVSPLSLRSRVRLVAGAPVCAHENLAAVLDEWETDARLNRQRVCYFGAAGRMMEVLGHRPGYSTVLLGAQPVWNPHDFENIVSHRSSLRAQIRRAQNKGVCVREWPCQQAENSSDLHRILMEWLLTRSLPALRFMVEPDTLSRLFDRRVFVALQSGVPVAWAVASPIPARDGWLIEQIVRGINAPNGVAELLIHDVMAALAQSGADYVTLGLVPLSHHAPPENWANNPAWLRLVLARVRAHGQRFYNFGGLDKFRAKMEPDTWEPIYAIANEPRFSPATLWAIADAFSNGSPVRAVSKGIGKAIKQEARWLLARPAA